MTTRQEAVRNIEIHIAYDGSYFHGWAHQPGRQTVQESIRLVAERFFKTKGLVVEGCSRTDSGVHALDQFASIYLPSSAAPIPEYAIPMALNQRLPRGVLCLGAKEVPINHFTRFEVSGKCYTYLFMKNVSRNPFLKNYACYPKKSIDWELFMEASKYFIGEKYFQNFTVKDTSRPPLKSSIREVYSINFTDHGTVVAITIKGNRFLYKMVRRIMGYLMKVGMGEFPIEETPKYFEPGDYYGIIPTADAGGLYLEKMFFDMEALHAYKHQIFPILQLP
ncbi:MAG: tRNA pseudouridine(38-40) synthase TruA [Lentisphaeria bacterium]|nr:tRNA pseudouridine(38-40) synthase TruA [Lentisphaeria bacterium]